mgnify:CR=1 FL=1
MKDDEDNEVLKIRSSCRQFRKKAEKNMASDQCTPLSDSPFILFRFRSLLFFVLRYSCGSEEVEMN